MADLANLSPYQRDILIKTALGEARGQGVEGMADVLQVILNRSNSGKFPSDPAKVALQPNEFSAWNKTSNGGNNPGQFSPGSSIYKTAEQALDAIVGGRPDPTGGALFYKTPAAKSAFHDKQDQYGTVMRNGHVYYPTHPVPPGEIPSVASLLDVKRAPPSPANLTPTGAAVRQMTSPTGGNSGLQSALNQYATREGNRVSPASAEDRVTARNRQFFSAPASPFGDDPMTPSNGPVVATIPSRPSFNGDPLTPTNGPVVARIPSTPSASDRVRGSNGWETIASIPSRTPSASDMARGRSLPPQQPNSGIASDMVRGNSPQSPIGQPPATRAVQSVPMRPNAFNGDPMTPASGPVVASIPSRPRVPMAMGVQQSYAGQDRNPYAPTIPDRLLPTPVGLPAQYGTMTPTQVAQIGFPSIAPPQITPMRQMPIVPRVPIQPQRQMVAQRAPIPQQRPGMFGQVPMRIGSTPLNILVSGSNTITAPNAFRGTATGQSYTPGQVFNTANGQVRANEGGGFTNVSTGRTSGHTVSGGLRYDPETAEFKRV